MLEQVTAAGHEDQVADRERADGLADPRREVAPVVDRDRALVLVVDVYRHIGAQRAIGGLRAAVEVEVRAMLRRIRAY